MTFINRISEYPSRFTLTDTQSQATQTVDIARADGQVTQEGTILNAEGIDEALESYFDAGQANADMVAAMLSGSKAILSGTVKSGTVAGLNVVALQGLTLTGAVVANGLIASGVASSPLPSSPIESIIRADMISKVRLTTTGDLYAVDALAAGTVVNTEFVWE